MGCSPSNSNAYPIIKQKSKLNTFERDEEKEIAKEPVIKTCIPLDIHEPPAPIIASKIIDSDIKLPPVAPVAAPVPYTRGSVVKQVAATTTTDVIKTAAAEPIAQYVFDKTCNGGWNNTENPQFLLTLDSKQSVDITVTRDLKTLGLVFKVFESSSYLFNLPKQPELYQSKCFCDGLNETVNLEAGTYVILLMQNFVNEEEGRAAENAKGSISVTKGSVRLLQPNGVTLTSKLDFNNTGSLYNNQNPQVFLKLDNPTMINITMIILSSNAETHGIRIGLKKCNSEGKRQLVWPNESKIEKQYFLSEYIATKSLKFEVPRLLSQGYYSILPMTSVPITGTVEIKVLTEKDPKATVSPSYYHKAVYATETFHSKLVAIQKECVVYPSSKVYNVDEARKMVQTITDSLINSSKRFLDADFPTQMKSINEPGANDLKEVEWARPSEYAEDPQLFTDGIEENDIEQGEIGNCWLCSNVGSLAKQNPRLIQSMFYPSAYNPVGIYAVSFFFDGSPMAVIIDDCVPVRDGKRCFGRGTDCNELWFTILEKAAAKLAGAYGLLIGGKGQFGSRKMYPLLTGGDYKVLETNVDKSWLEETKSYLDKGYLVSCSSAEKDVASIHTETINKDGIVSLHEYSLLEAVSAENDSIQLLKLRNPWANQEWQGDWSDKSNLWSKHPAIAAQCKFDMTVLDEGVFWISVPDFQKNFPLVKLCSIPEQTFAHTATITQTFRPGTHVSRFNILRNMQIVLTSAEVGCSAYITLRRSDQGPETGICFQVYDYPDSYEVGCPFNTGKS